MGFTSILGHSPWQLKASEIEYSSFFADLNIDLIVERILLKWADYPLLKYFYYPAYTEDEVRFRQEVYEELEDAGFREQLIAFSQGMKRSRQFLEYRDRLWQQMQRQGARKDLTGVSARTASEIKYRYLLYDAVREYVHAVDFLWQILEKRDCSSRGFYELRDFLKEYCSGEEFRELSTDVEQMGEAIGELHFQFEIKQNKLTLYEDYDDRDARDEFMERCGMKNPLSKAENSSSLDVQLSHQQGQLQQPGRQSQPRQPGQQSQPQEMKSPFPNILDLKEFEGLILSMLHQTHKDVFRQFVTFEKKHEDCILEIFLRFEEEVQVYLAAHQFFAEMKEYNFSFAIPMMLSRKPEKTNTAEEPVETTEVSVDIAEKTVDTIEETVDDRIGGLSEKSFTSGRMIWQINGSYDAALAIKYAFTPEKVIMNDLAMLDGEQFCVITGPNQGGKTTFARAVGQAVWFHQMGFPVPGTRAQLPVFSSILTHFPQEENLETGAGRLKEELERMKPMMEESCRGGFVILNELFTTATSYDALIMGERIIKSFLERDFCGIYVTHFHKLADCDSRVVSLVAQVEDMDEKKRTFRICRAKAKGIAYAQTFAEKYRLSYEDILERVRQQE